MEADLGLALNDVASMIKVAGADLSDLHDEMKRHLDEMKKVKGKLDRGEGARSDAIDDRRRRGSVTTLFGCLPRHRVIHASRPILM
jgi:hypothetical protein